MLDCYSFEVLTKICLSYMNLHILCIPIIMLKWNGKLFSLFAWQLSYFFCKNLAYMRCQIYLDCLHDPLKISYMNNHTSKKKIPNYSWFSPCWIYLVSFACSKKKSRKNLYKRMNDRDEENISNHSFRIFARFLQSPSRWAPL